MHYATSIIVSLLTVPHLFPCQARKFMLRDMGKSGNHSNDPLTYAHKALAECSVVNKVNEFVMYYFFMHCMMRPDMERATTCFLSEEIKAGSDDILLGMESSSSKKKSKSSENQVAMFKYLVSEFSDLKSASFDRKGGGHRHEKEVNEGVTVCTPGSSGYKTSFQVGGKNMNVLEFLAELEKQFQNYMGAYRSATDQLKPFCLESCLYYKQKIKEIREKEGEDPSASGSQPSDLTSTASSNIFDRVNNQQRTYETPAKSIAVASCSHFENLLARQCGRKK